MAEPVSRERAADFGPIDAGNTSTAATAVPFGISIAGRVGDAGDSDDWYRFTAPVAGALTVRLTGLADDLNLFVRNSSLQLLGSSQRGGLADETASNVIVFGGGTYFIHVDPFLLAASDYQLSFSFVTPPDDGGSTIADAVPVAIGATVVSSVGYVGDDADVFKWRAGGRAVYV